MRIEVKNGKSIRIWDKHWIPDFVGQEVQLLPGVERGIHWVSDLLQGDGRGWDEDKVRATFTTEFCNSVLSIKSLKPDQEDFWIWSLDRKGSLKPIDIVIKLKG
ncbi:retrotransposon protein [Striga asiatica]|uniref:Retrotransposon protein n=1 Tax=Striga asiatica TaxID=4170 RepID=A0A5A7PWN4_STRAF|nr:retrotransposon protein [Striga asiatica]